MTEEETQAVQRAVKIDLHVSSEDVDIETAVLSMDELKIHAGPLNLYLNAEAVKILYKKLRDNYTAMSDLSNLPDPLPQLD